jgi:hypothetical protein
MKTHLPLSGPVAISASIMCCINLTTISRVPFARSPGIFRSKITGQPSCRVKVWGGTFDMLREFRNSVGVNPSLFALHNKINVVVCVALCWWAVRCGEVKSIHDGGVDAVNILVQCS